MYNSKTPLPWLNRLGLPSISYLCYIYLFFLYFFATLVCFLFFPCHILPAFPSLKHQLPLWSSGFRCIEDFDFLFLLIFQNSFFGCMRKLLKRQILLFLFYFREGQEGRLCLASLLNMVHFRWQVVYNQQTFNVFSKPQTVHNFFGRKSWAWGPNDIVGSNAQPHLHWQSSW